MQISFLLLMQRMMQTDSLLIIFGFLKQCDFLLRLTVSAWQTLNVQDNERAIKSFPFIQYLQTTGINVSKVRHLFP